MKQKMKFVVGQEVEVEGEEMENNMEILGF